MARNLYLWRGASEPPEVAATGTSTRPWRGALEPVEVGGATIAARLTDSAVLPRGVVYLQDQSGVNLQFMNGEPIIVREVTAAETLGGTFGPINLSGVLQG